MEKKQLYSLCGKHLIDINIALENEELRELLKNKASNETIDKFLMEEF